ncbi:betaine aldehyde dehydrogenase [Apiospora rasikravindrae]|uniref:Betaine aldehyde dehydrogenase n=1 Tax=Apiospora rasikravindrae TaxID=990691 RepID=A0ABR1TWM1_9PEZI
MHFTPLFAALVLPLLAAAAPTPEPNQSVAQATSTYYLDCGSNSVTNMCSAKNSGASCNPTTGALTINLAGSCGACKCIKDPVCTRGCAKK